MSYRLLLPVLLLVATSGYAQTAAPMPRKMAVIDFDRAVLGNLEGVKARGQLETRLKYWQEQAETLAAERKKLNDKLSESGVSDAEKTKIRAQISEIDVRLNRNREDAQKDIDSRRTALFTPVADRVKNVLKAYGDEQNLAVVINDTATVEGPVIFRSDVADITSEVIRRVNADIEKNPAKTPAAEPSRD